MTKRDGMSWWRGVTKRDGMSRRRGTAETEKRQEETGRMRQQEGMKEPTARQEEGTDPYAMQIEQYIYREYRLNPDFPISAFLIGRYVFPPEPAQIRWLHYHNCVEIIYSHEERILDIEDHIYFLEPGSICLVMPGQMHNSRSAVYRQRASDQGCEYLYLDPKELLRDFFTETYSFSEIYDQIRREKCNVILHRDNSLICELVWEILEGMRQGDQTDRDGVKGIFLAFWVELIRMLDTSKEETSQMGKRRELTDIYPAMCYIREHFGEDISLEVLAKLCHMSPSRLRQNFLTCTGVTPRQYIEERRMSHACELLAETEESILEIAYACGYNSLSVFQRHFAKVWGENPTAWRKRRTTVSKRQAVHTVY